MAEGRGEVTNWLSDSPFVQRPEALGRGLGGVSRMERQEVLFNVV